MWRDKNHAIELFTEKVTWEKLKYIHRNPVLEKLFTMNWIIFLVQLGIIMGYQMFWRLIV